MIRPPVLNEISFGKALAKSLALRMTAFGVRVYVPGDPKGEWGEVARALGSEPIVLGRGNRVWEDLRGLESTHDVSTVVAESGTIHVTFARKEAR